MTTTATPGRELLALADKFEAGTHKAVSTGYEEYGEAFQRERKMIVDALRLAAKPADDGWTFAKLLSNALLKIRPLGGSELFVKRNDDYYADPQYCGHLIEEMQAALHKARVEKVRLEKSLSTTGEPKR